MLLNEKILVLLTAFITSTTFFTPIVSCGLCSRSSPPEEANLPNKDIDFNLDEYSEFEDLQREASENDNIQFEDSPLSNFQSEPSKIENKSNDNKIKADYEYTMLSTGSGLFQYLKKDDTAIIYDTGIGGPPNRWHTKLYNGNIWPTKFLKENGINKISAIFLSHFHTDHYSNLRTILNNFPVENIVFNYEGDVFIKKFANSISPNTKVHAKLAENYTFNGIKFHNWSYYAKDFLDKESKKKSVNRNNLSNIIYFKIGKTKFLFTGDAEKNLGNAIAKESPNIFKSIDIYQVPHHGSKNSLDSTFFGKLNPKNCYIPGTYDEENTSWRTFVGAASHKFPDGPIVDQLKASGCQEISMTGKPYAGLTSDQLGKIDNSEVTITVYLNKNGDIIDKKYFKNTILNSL